MNFEIKKDFEYLGGCLIEGDIGTWAPEIWDKLLEIYQIKKYIDIGCGAGHSLKYFLDKGIEGMGIEGYDPAIDHSVVKQHIVKHDYTKEPYIPKETFDLAWCCEFVEHVEEQYSENFLKTFDNCKIIAMTHGLPGQPGFHHVNCQEPEYWIKKMNDRGFYYNKNFSIELRELLPKFTVKDGIFLNENGEVGKFNNIIDEFLPNGAHIKNTLLIFEKQK